MGVGHLIVATVEDLTTADNGDAVAAAKRAGLEVLDKTTVDGLRPTPSGAAT